MVKFFFCFGGHPDELKRFDKVLELGDIATTFNLAPDRGGLSEDELKKELSTRGLLYELDPDLKLEIPSFRKEVPPYRKDVPPCWGILVGIEGIEDYEKALFLMELYSGHIFTPLYVIDRFGKAKKIERGGRSQNYYDGLKDGIRDYFDEKFPEFVELILPQMDTVGWNAFSVGKWRSESDFEKFRTFTAISLYRGLSEYAHSKSVLFWTKEALEMGIILETLLGNPEKDENQKKSAHCEIKEDGIAKKLRERTQVLLGNKSDRNIVNEIYKSRSDFVHGSELIRKIMDSHGLYDNGMAKLPCSEDIFELPAKWGITLRKIVILYLVVSTENEKLRFGTKFSSVRELLDCAKDNETVRSIITELRVDIGKKCVW